jgi:anaerobic ribonucleoside-triphosphate reductase
MNYVNPEAQSKSLVIPAEIYSRISGYYRPVFQWNNAKRQEFKERLNLKVPENLI